MGRTMYYNMEGKTAKKEKEKIMEIERKYNKKYRWRGEKLSLSRGFTKIYDSDNDARRLIIAITEISTKIPEKEWRIQDDENVIDGRIKKGVFTGKIDLKKMDEMQGMLQCPCNATENLKEIFLASLEKPLAFPEEDKR